MRVRVNVYGFDRCRRPVVVSRRDPVILTLTSRILIGTRAAGNTDTEVSTTFLLDLLVTPKSQTPNGTNRRRRTAAAIMRP